MTKLSLAEVLARAPLEELKALAGLHAVELFSRVFGRVDNDGISNLILGQLGQSAALRSADIRAAAISHLTGPEAESLRQAMELSPGAEIVPAAFAQNRTLEQALFAFLGVDYDEINRSEAPSSRLVSPADIMTSSDLQAFYDLRSLVGRRSQDVLLRMPMGSGKIRMVASTVIDLLRSSKEGDTALWLTDGVRYCEDVFKELETTWRRVGNRELTMFRAYGPNRFPTLHGLRDSVVVADVTSFSAMSTSHEQIEDVASRLRCIVLSDANYVLDRKLSDLIDKLRLAGAGNLIGMSALTNNSSDAALERRYPNVVTRTGRTDGPLVEFDVNRNTEVRVFPTGFQGQITVDRFDISKASIEQLEGNVERSARLLELIQAEVFTGSAVAFQAVSANQAHAFAGVLKYRSTFASAITSQMSPAEQEQTAREFNIRSKAMAVCLEEIPLLDREMKKPTTLILARPTSSFSKLSASVGRFLSKRDAGVTLKVIIVDDGFEPFTDMAEHISLPMTGSL